MLAPTYEDLREERQEVMQALLELDCIPSGMELFPAANEDQWTLIKEVINDCDYYIVVVAGRYGSIAPSGKSYTQMEYEYAVEMGKPVIGFVHASPADIPTKATEKTDSGKVALENFRSLIKKRAVRTFRNAGDLGSVVSRSLIKLIKTHPASGWIRADQALDQLSAAEILRLRKQNEDLRAQLSRQSDSAPAGAESLSQGNELFEITFDIEFDSSDGQGTTWSKDVKISWDEICKTVLPVVSGGGSETKIAQALEKRCSYGVELQLNKTEKNVENLKLNIIEGDLTTVLIQLQALGLITKSPQSVKIAGGGTRVQWQTTPFGEATLVKLFAIPRKKAISRTLEKETNEADSNETTS